MSSISLRTRGRSFLLLIAVVPLTMATLPAAGSAQESESRGASASDRSEVIRDWERTLFRTVYTEALTPIPIGVPYLGFTSLAMYDAVKTAQRRGNASPEATAAVAAHDVLVEYFSTSSEANLDADLAASLADVPDGVAKTRGIAIGAQVASDLIESRADDGRNDESIVYNRAVEPGVWQPATGGSMVGAWLGFMDLLVLKHRVGVNGPDPITSARYAFDYQEVKRIGAASGADRTPYQTDTALFFNANAPRMFSEGLLGHLDAEPSSLRKTARMFAVMHAATTDSVITCWRLKYDEGFWRPFQAIQGAATDGNLATVADPTWAPLVANPSYADYVSGHACATSPAMETIRRMLGEETALTLHSSVTNTDRTYATLSEIEFDAFHARIWGGLHFRDAMEDGYYIGHTAAQRVLHQLN